MTTSTAAQAEKTSRPRGRPRDSGEFPERFELRMSAGTLAAVDAARGEDDRSAFVRAAIDAAIEAVKRAASVDAHRSKRATIEVGRRDRAVGALMGLAIGDALGTTLEFSTRDRKRPLTDIVGGGPFGLQPGQWTDDTAQAIILGESIVERGRFDGVDFLTRLVRWWRKGEGSCTGVCFDIGETTKNALAFFEANGRAFESPVDHSGNGSLMRLAPVAIRWSSSIDQQLRDMANEQSRTTHTGITAAEACEYLALVIADAISGVGDKADVLRNRTGGFHRRWTSDAVAGISKGGWRRAYRADLESGGYSAHTLKAALWCVDQTETFEAAVLMAANLGDDADTTAAVTGQIAGALYGASAIPERWKAMIAWRRRIEDLAGALHDAGR